MRLIAAPKEEVPLRVLDHPRNGYNSIISKQIHIRDPCFAEDGSLVKAGRKKMQGFRENARGETDKGYIPGSEGNPV